MIDMNTHFHGPVILDGDRLIISLYLDPSQHYLDHHRVGGIPLLGNAMAIEAMATAAVRTNGAGKLCIQSVRGPNPCFVQTPRSILVGAERKGDSIECQVFHVTEGREELYFTSAMSFGTFHAPTTIVPECPDKTVSGEEVYLLYFHGPAFRVVERAWLEGEIMFAIMKRTLPPVFDNGLPVAAPRLIELCLQTAGLWEVAVLGRMRIPKQIGRIVLYEKVDEYSTELTAAARKGRHGINIILFDNEGRICVEVIDYLTAPLPFPVDENAIKKIKSQF
jgi:hypothetical protein